VVAAVVAAVASPLRRRLRSRGHGIQRDPRKLRRREKINIINGVREITGQGLARSESHGRRARPKTIKESIEKKAAEDIKKKLEEAGAKVAVKPA